MNSSLKNSPKNEQISSQLKRIVSSNAFNKSSKLRDFLSFIVQETLKEDGMELKQYTIAVYAFGRDANFNPIDPIVRMQAGRLRRILQDYYREEGRSDEVLILLEKGSYIPQFTFQEYNSESNESQSQIFVAQNNTLAIFPFKNLSIEDENQYIVDGFTEELLLEISRYKYLQLIRAKNENSVDDDLSISKFSLKGSIRFYDESVKIFISVIDNKSHQQIWSDQKKLNAKCVDWIEVQEEIAINVANHIADVTGVLSNVLMAKSNWENTATPQAYDAMLLLHQFNNNPNDSNLEKAVESLERIVKVEPKFGPGLAVLGGLYTDAFMLGTGSAYIEKALEYGSKAVEIQPDCQVCHTCYAYTLFVDNQKDLSLKHIKIALALNPNAPYFIGCIGWCYCLTNEWEKGIELLNRSISLDFKYPKWFHLATFLHFLLLENNHDAYEEASKLNVSGLFWDPLVKLVACQRLNKVDEANEHFSNLIQIKPDFIENSEQLVGHLVKDKSLKEVITKAIQSVSSRQKQRIEL